MQNKDLHETLIAIARVPGEFYRDTNLLLNALDRVTEIDRNLKAEFCEQESANDKE